MRRARARGGVKQWQVRGEVVRLVDRARLVTDGPTEVPLLKQLRDLGLSPARERQARLFSGAQKAWTFAIETRVDRRGPEAGNDRQQHYARFECAYNVRVSGNRR